MSDLTSVNPDHDLLVTISVQMADMRIAMVDMRRAMDEDRRSHALRSAKYDSDFEIYKKECVLNRETDRKVTEDRFKSNEAMTDEIKANVVKIYAVASTISLFVGIIVKVFWK